MGKVKSIAVTGKGGTGKTVVSTLILKTLLKNPNKKILVIDADSAMSLPYTLGIKVNKTVSEVRKSIVGRDQLRSPLDDAPTKEIMREILSHGEGFDLLAMGRPEEPGCFCAVNDLLRYGIEALIGDYDIAIIDGEAGPEQLNRRVLKEIDALLVVSDMSVRSLETAGGILKVAKDNEDGIRVKKAGLILNRVKNDEPAQKSLDNTGMDVFARLPEDALVNSYDREGKSLLDLPEDSPCLEEIDAMVAKLVVD